VNMKRAMISIFYFLSRTCSQIFPFTFVYDWPNKRIVIGKIISRMELQNFLGSLWPKSTDQGLKRYGTDGDGGYLLPKTIVQYDYCYSAGIDRNSDFEFDIAEHFKCKIFMLDASVDGPARTHEQFYFEKIWLGSVANATTYEVNDWVKKYSVPETKDILFKIDIEGSEYEVFDAIDATTQNKLSVIVCEFHSFENILLEKQARYRSILKKILKTHDVIHLHPNNVRRPYRRFQITIPTDLEITFVRKGLIQSNNEIVSLPNSLDYENVSGLPINLNWERHV
jgi:hypothetical protein